MGSVNITEAILTLIDKFGVGSVFLFLYLYFLLVMQKKFDSLVATNNKMIGILLTLSSELSGLNRHNDPKNFEGDD